jgi:hypothetical protein
MKRLTFQELLTAPIPKTIINEPIEDWVVDFTVHESAEARARRRWFKGKDHDQG